jgi:hypothetical protein
MPTELPVRSGVQARNAKWAEYGQALFILYGSAGLAVLLLIALETRLGTCDGLTATETVIKTTRVQSLYDGIDPNWASPPPF